VLETLLHLPQIVKGFDFIHTYFIFGYSCVYRDLNRSVKVGILLQIAKNNWGSSYNLLYFNYYIIVRA